VKVAARRRGFRWRKVGRRWGLTLAVSRQRGEEVRSETHLQDRQFAIAIAESCEDEENKWR